MRLGWSLLASGAVAAVALVTACSSSNPNDGLSIPPPSAPATSGPMTLSGQPSTQSLSSSTTSVSGSVTYPGGSGTVTASAGTTAPTGITAVSPVSLLRMAADVTSPTVYYVTITSSTGATLKGIPGVALTISTPWVGPTPFVVQEAEWSGTAWVNVVQASVNSGGTSIVVAAGTSAITIPANGSLYLAFYQGLYPAATPTPVATPTNIIADSTFANATVVPDTNTPAPVSSGGWTQCSITAVSSEASPGAAPPQAISNYTPNPDTTPGAVIEAAGTSVTQGSATPTPTQTTVPTYGGDANAAVFGGLFSTYNQGNYAYNGLCQLVTVPQNPSVSMELLANGNEGSSYFDFDVLALDPTGKYLATIYVDPNPIGSPAASPGDSTYRSVSQNATALTPYVGQSVEIFVGIWTKAGSSSGSTKYSGYYFADNFQLSGVPVP